MKEEYKGYKTYQNVMFAICNQWRWNKTVVFIMLLMMIIQILMPVIGIYMPKLVIEILQNGSGIKDLLILVLYFTAAMLLLNTGLSFSRNYMTSKGIVNRLRYMQNITEKSMKTDYSNMASEKGQTLLSKAFLTVNNNSSATEQIYSQLTSVGKNIIGILVYGSLIAVLNPIIIAILAVGGLVVFLTGRAVNQYKFRHREEKGRIDKKFNYVERASSDYSFAKDIRLYGMFEWITNVFKKSIKEGRDWHTKVMKREVAHTTVEGLIAFLRDGFAYAYLIYLVLNGMAVSDFVLYFGAIAGFSMWVSGFAGDMLEIHQSSNEFNIFREFLEMKDRSNHETGRDIEPLRNKQLSIEFKDVTFCYPGSSKPLFRNFNLKIDANSNCAIVGINGAGKTTLVKLLTGLYRPDEGSILINGIDSAEFNIDEYFSLFSVAFQDAAVTAFTLQENITMKTFGSVEEKDLIPVLNASNLYEKVQSMTKGINTSLLKELDTEGTVLSGGETQKLILARALYSDREILILDEPTASLDPIAEADLYEKYHAMAENKTSIYISHRLSSTKFCDEIIFLKDGIIAERGTHTELMDNDSGYAEMFTVQSHYYKENAEVIS